VAAYFVVADTTRRTFAPGVAALARASGERLKQLVIYQSAAVAAAAGFQPRERAAKSAPAKS
jgi:hypothetical protein